MLEDQVTNTASLGEEGRRRHKNGRAEEHFEGGTPHQIYQDDPVHFLQPLQAVKILLAVEINDPPPS